MSEWLVERGIGEVRAALVENGGIIEARIERPRLLRAGDIWRGRLTRTLRPKRGEAVIAGETILVDPWPAGVTEGAETLLAISREPVPERGRPRAAKAAPAPRPAMGAPSTTFVIPSAVEGRTTLLQDRSASFDCALDEDLGRIAQNGLITAAPALIDELRAGGTPVRLLEPLIDDALETAGWSELIEEARTGIVGFGGGVLSIVPTPAGTTIDVDGALPPAELARAGAAAAGAAIRRLGIGGSILVDLPSIEGKAARQAAASALDAALPPPFERTGVNGFGLLQVVRPRARPSLVELVQNAGEESAALTLLRRAERAGVGGSLTLRAAPAVTGWIDARPPLLDELARRTGARIVLNPDAAVPLWSGHVHHAR